MKGLELSKKYFYTFGQEMLEKKYKNYLKYMSIGLVGEGSECFGYDDLISQDHDFSPDFCIWIPREIYSEIGASLEKDYLMLPSHFEGFERKNTGRRGVLTVEGFYEKYIGSNFPPKNNFDWFKAPMENLSVITNGTVFVDNFGVFTSVRNEYKNYYPEDVIKKKLAAQVTYMAQSGQYNYRRLLKRGDYEGAYMTAHEFIHHGLKLLYLVNSSYMPFYKWAFRGTESFLNLTEVRDILKELSQMNEKEQGREKEALMENASLKVGAFLNRKGYTVTNNSFLEAHGKEIMKSIEDVDLKNLPILLDF